MTDIDHATAAVQETLGMIADRVLKITQQIKAPLRLAPKTKKEAAHKILKEVEEVEFVHELIRAAASGKSLLAFLQSLPQEEDLELPIKFVEKVKTLELLTWSYPSEVVRRARKMHVEIARMRCEF